VTHFVGQVAEHVQVNCLHTECNILLWPVQPVQWEVWVCLKVTLPCA